MFGKHHTLKHCSVGIAAAASVAVVAVPSALAAHDTWYRNAVSQASVRPSVPFTTDTLGGNGQVTQVRGYDPQAYVYGGASPAVSKAIQDRGFGRTASPPVVVASASSGTSFSWGDAGIGAGIAAGLLLLFLLTGTRLRMHKRSAITA
jgi:hypothetical protein